MSYPGFTRPVEPRPRQPHPDELRRAQWENERARERGEQAAAAAGRPERERARQQAEVERDREQRDREIAARTAREQTLRDRVRELEAARQKLLDGCAGSGAILEIRQSAVNLAARPLLASAREDLDRFTKGR